MRPDQLEADEPLATEHPPRRGNPSMRTISAWWCMNCWLLAFALPPLAPAQIPPPQLDAARAPDLAARRASILAEERTRLAASGVLTPEMAGAADGASRFVPLREVVPAAEASPDSGLPTPARAIRLEVAGKLFDLARSAAKTPAPPLALIDECLRGVIERDPNHAEARRLLGFIPHQKTGWATPFAADQLRTGKVKDPTFGWVPKDWVPHLQHGELPAPYPSKSWLPAAEADALRRDPRNDLRSGWTIFTEHFEIHANVPLSEVIAFGRHLETFHQLFGAMMADLIGAEQLPLARRLKNPQLQPTVAGKPHLVSYFATREDYAQHLAPFLGDGVRQSLGIYIPRKESRVFGGRSYFFNDVGGQLDVTATLYHEVSHQLLFESAGPSDYTQNVGNYWVFEGLGTYFETVQPLADGSIRVGGLVGPRIAQAKRRLVDGGELVPIEPFVAMGRATFQGKDGDTVIYLHYAEAMALAVFLMQAHDGRYREPFLDYARDAYRGQFRGRGGRTLEARLDRPYADLEREFLAYLGRAGVATPK